MRTTIPRTIHGMIAAQMQTTLDIAGSFPELVLSPMMLDVDDVYGNGEMILINPGMQQHSDRIATTMIATIIPTLLFFAGAGADSGAGVGATGVGSIVSSPQDQMGLFTGMSPGKNPGGFPDRIIH